jgi:RNA polymerase sigma-70 factor (ECF subfamily)
MEQTLSTQNELSIKTDIEIIFKKYYKLIFNIINGKIRDYNLADDLTQDVFYELYRKKDKIKIQTSLKSYLIRSAINTALNQLRKKKIEYTETLPETHYDNSYENDYSETDILKQVLYNAIDNLPPKCKQVFVMSRTHGLTYEEIAEELGIAKKTVDNHIGKALSILRTEMNKFKTSRC